MINKVLTNMEIAEELGIDVDTAKDLVEGKGEWRTEDIGRLLEKHAEKLGKKDPRK
jgi:orotate phosphoribosyltransferase-like protein